MDLKTLMISVAAGAVMLLPVGASASTITYDLVDVSVPNAYFGTITVTGTFTFNLATLTTTSANITVSSSDPRSPLYDSILFNTAISQPGNGVELTNSQGDTLSLGSTVNGGNQIGRDADIPLTDASIQPPALCPPTGCSFIYGPQLPAGYNGQADPVATPIPAALPLFAGGLGALGLLGWRRKRKAEAFARDQQNIAGTSKVAAVGFSF